MAAPPNPPSNPFLDMIQNQEPIALPQVLNIVASLVLTWIDSNVTHFSENPFYTWVAVYLAGQVVAIIYARMRAWSPDSVQKAVNVAAATGLPVAEVPK